MSATGSDKIKDAVISVLGSGHMRPASGSWGSLVACGFFALLWLICVQFNADRVVLEAATVVGILLACVVSVLWGEWAVNYYGRKDPSQFVLDEFAGQWIALLVLPLTLSAGFWPFAFVLGGQFFLFRLFDVTKPPPARQLERLPFGWGILLDDLFAGFYANIVGQLIWRLTPLSTWLVTTSAGH